MRAVSGELVKEEIILAPEISTPFFTIPAVTGEVVTAPTFAVGDLDLTRASVVCRLQSAYADYNALRVTESYAAGALQTVAVQPLFGLTRPDEVDRVAAGVACLIVERTDCEVDADCDDGVCNAGGQCTACLADTDCDDGDACTTDVCTLVSLGGASVGTCGSNPAGDVIGLVCDPETGDFVECLADADCDGGFCDADNACVACLEDAHCGAGTVCTDWGICSECGHAADCEDGDLCTTDVCDLISFGGVTQGTCRSTAVAEPIGRYCDPATGDLVECVVDAECGVDGICWSGTCGGECPPDSVSVGGACWFAGERYTNCDDTCADHGFTYDDATRTYAGSDGTDNHCSNVLTALYDDGQIPDDSNNNVGFTNMGIGCAYTVGGRSWVRGYEPTTSSEAPSAFNLARACACQ